MKNSCQNGSRRRQPAFVPLIPVDQSPPEFTLRASILGILLGIFFNVGNIYLGLKAGMTISASIPAAVLSIATFKIFFRRTSILENNIVQTIASVGEGVASGVIFTVPALLFLNASISLTKIFFLSLSGGILGILFMIPMRQYIIVKGHGKLPFPEGTACASIFRASMKTDIQNAATSLWGIIIGMFYRGCVSALHIWNDLLLSPSLKDMHNFQFRLEGSPALLGIGYIIGPKIASLTFAGGMLSWWIFIPCITFFGGSSTIFPGGIPIAQMDAMTIWENYVRYIGAGAVAVGGIYNLLKIIPLIFHTLHSGIRQLFHYTANNHTPRTERDIPTKWLILTSICIIALLWLSPNLNFNLFAILLLIILSFFFTAVTSITVGIIGSSSNPASGMVLTILLITGTCFSLLGWTEKFYLIMAITISIISTVIITLASTTSQDLKTGFLLGATPIKQQISEIVGLIFPSLLTGIIIFLLDKAYGLGSTNLPAPQASILAIIGQGIFERQLPLILVFIGIVLGCITLLLRISILPLAVGLYLPLEITTAIMFGGLVRIFLEYKQTDKEHNETNTLLASGLVAGDTCMGVIIALGVVSGWITQTPKFIIPTPLNAFFFLLLTAIFIYLGSHFSSKNT